jgi:hypothetical protein
MAMIMAHFRPSNKQNGLRGGQLKRGGSLFLKKFNEVRIFNITVN